MDVQYNSTCYTFEQHTYKNGLLDACVDATYIIHLKTNSRMTHIREQLSEFQPTKTVYVAINQGYKNCTKKLIEQAPYQDLTDAFLQCFRHADAQGYNNILILEDDFIFSPDMKQKQHTDNVCRFIQSRGDEPFIYYLGCIPIGIVPYDLSTYYSLKSLTYHSVIYSKKARSQIKDYSSKHWDVIVENNISSRYLYYKPLCYQLFPETENKKAWKDKDSSITTNIKNMTIQGLQMNKTPEPGFSILYYFAKFLFLLCITILAVLLYYVIKHTKILKKRYNKYI